MLEREEEVEQRRENPGRIAPAMVDWTAMNESEEQEELEKIKRMPRHILDKVQFGKKF